MDRLIVHKPFHYWIIASIIFPIISLGCAAWLMTNPIGEANTNIHRDDTTKPIFVPKQPVVKKPTPPVPPVFTSDYTLPPVENGIPPVITTIPTKQNVVFLGIDDGAFKDPSVIDIMRQNHIKATLFLSKAFISGNPDFFKQITALGSVIEDHTISHDTNMVSTQTYAEQKAEICDMADYIQQHYGHRPTLFRPPGGAYSQTMLDAAGDCGMRAVVNWIAKANGGSMQYQIGNGLRPGDVVLMHFRPEFKQDMQAFVDAETAAGLHTELLEDIPSGT
jgi:peptidoglycan/xylan/chitin deacetylase (PgdA/CDA1 family)